MTLVRLQSVNWTVRRISMPFRHFSFSLHADSGHSHWATIKHDKKKNDDAKQKVRGILISEIVIASRRE
jgi:hypothetical protein